MALLLRKRSFGKVENMYKFWVYLSLVVLGLTLVACDGDLGIPDLGNPGSIHATVVDYTGPAAQVDAVTEDENGDDVFVGTGFISEEGTLTLELDDTVPPSVLRPFTGLDTGISTPSNAKVMSTSPFDVYSGGTEIGWVFPASSPGAVFTVLFGGQAAIGEKLGVYFYADRDVTITGVDEPGSGDILSITIEYDLHLEEGWNFSVLELVDADDEDLSLTLEHYTATPSALEWQWFDRRF